MTTAPAGLDLSSRPHPRREMLHGLRPLARALVRTRYDVRVHGADQVPTRGPVVLASNHVGVIDGPLLAAFAPRPVHALTKEEMFRGAMGAFLRGAGQIPLDRFHPDPSALKTCVRVLRDSGVVGIFPEGIRCDGELHRFHHGAAWLGLASGSPVVPVTLVGTRDAGGHASSLPARGARIDMVFGRPWQVPYQPAPRRRAEVVAASAALLEHMLGQQHAALSALGRALPGPLPPGEHDADPDTGFIHPADQSGQP